MARPPPNSARTVAQRVSDANFGAKACYSGIPAAGLPACTLDGEMEASPASLGPPPGHSHVPHLAPSLHKLGFGCVVPGNGMCCGGPVPQALARAMGLSLPRHGYVPWRGVAPKPTSAQWKSAAPSSPIAHRGNCPAIATTPSTTAANRRRGKAFARPGMRRSAHQ
eukprot:CAMPEP_0117571210 /NCGR_PEP_ID=MMETSP0784-20121206/59620_1 /TAXON_ID=39447 /ORGANISM="" /LENGTH=165 /DNA_ID=CAMNT_0005369335 /DNA_START=159 /DNA_END=654 /DNA_ORIENTATION=-